MRGSVNVPGPGVPKMATGTYTGSGGDQTLTFDFVPKVIWIAGGTPYPKNPIFQGDEYTSVPVDAGALGETYGVTFVFVRVIWRNEKTVTFSHISGYSDRENELSLQGETYRYFAIGE